MQGSLQVEIYASEITDLRSIEERLRALAVDYSVNRQSMASAGAREEFRALCDRYNWHYLPMVFVDGNFVGGEKELWASITQRGPVNALTKYLTLAGVIPFVVGSVLLWVDPGSLIAGLLPMYGWIILSFMAGCIWGFAEASPALRGCSVVLPLLAWPSAVLLGPQSTYLTLGVLFVSLLALDLRLLRLGLISHAYWTLRSRVTGVVLVSLCVALSAFLFN